MTEKNVCMEVRKWAFEAPGRLGPDETKRMQSHLGSCRDCARFLQFEQAFAAHFKSIAPRETVPESLRARLMSLVESASAASMATAETLPPTPADTADLETGVITTPSGTPASKAPTAVPPTQEPVAPESTHGPGATSRRTSKLRLARERISTRMGRVKAPEKFMKEVPVKDWERYQFVSFLGKGGMGKVYKAYDPMLDRYVALKFLRTENPEISSRFVMEAQAQARVEHKNVCKVYEVGEVDEKLYIAMQFIEGKTLGKAAKEMNREQLISVFIDICEAIHAAHRTGLIHRDIKPANVMVEKLEDEGWHPYVMDFGLAREVQAPGLTQQGMIVGSPWYMSPEQARGENQNLDRRTDVYSLGATLYELLTGKPPFEGESSVAVLWKVMEEDPPPVRKKNPSVPEDLETIVMKCLEKDPGRRYDSARALAEDLRRFLNDEPILARKASRIYRFRKKVKKHKALFAVSSVAAMLILALTAASVTAVVRGNIRARFAQRFGQTVKELESMARLTYMLPAHDVRKDRRNIARRVQELQEQAERLGALGRGPALYAAGRAYLSLERLRLARDLLQDTWERWDYREPEVAFALGHTFGELYLQALDRAERIDNEVLRKAAIQEAKKRYRLPATRYLRMAAEQEEQAFAESPLYVRALLAFYEGNYNQALAAAVKAAEHHPYLFEARKVEGDVYVTQAFEQRDRGKYDRAEALLKKALEAYAHTVEVARSSPAGYVGLCRSWDGMMLVQLDQGQDPSAAYQKALEACGNALKVDPNNVEARNKMAYAHLRWAYHRIDMGEDPTEFIDKAVKAARASVAVEENAEGLRMLGTGLWMQGLNAWYGGEDPTEFMNQALETFKKARKLAPRDPDILANMGNVYGVLSDLAQDQGEDPRKFMQQALDAFTAAIKLNPNIPEPYFNMAHVYSRKGEYEEAHGIDPMSSYQAAMKAIQDGLKINPENVDMYNELGLAYWAMGRVRLQRGERPAEEIRNALKAFAKAREIDPELELIYTNKLLIHQLDMEYAVGHGLDPLPIYQRAQVTFQKARELNPESPEAYLNFAMIRAGYLEYLQLLGKNPQKESRPTLRLLRKAVELNPDFPESYHYLIDVFHTLARWKLEQGRSPLTELREAEKTLKTALDIDPESVETLRRQARNDLLRGEWAWRQGRSPLKAAQAALASARKALEVNPALAANHLVLGQVHRLRASWWADRDPQKAVAEIQEARKALDACLKKNPTLAEAVFEQGRLEMIRSRFEKNPRALSDILQRAETLFEKALKINAHLRRRVDEQLNRIQEKREALEENPQPSGVRETTK